MPKHAAALFCTRRRWTAEDAREALVALDRSGLSTAEFALREGIDPQRLYWWRRRFATSSPAEAITPAFVELPRSALPVVEVLLRSGRVLRVSAAIDATALRRLVEALEEDDAC